MSGNIDKCTAADKPKTFKMMVACVDSNGSSDFYLCDVDGSDVEMQEGEIHKKACSMASEAGYNPPFLAFDKTDQSNIARVVEHLECDIPFTLTDDSDENSESIDCRLSVESGTLWVGLDGFTDYSCGDDKGLPLCLEQWKGEVNVRIYGDVNSEEPTHSISLEGARNEKIIDTDSTELS